MVTRQQRRARERAKAKVKQTAPAWQSAKKALGLFCRSLFNLVWRLIKPILWLPWWADALGILCAIGVGYEAYYATIPEIDVVETDQLSPFVAPFRVYNSSLLFSAIHVAMFCRVDEIVSSSGAHVTGGGTLDNMVETIPPRGIANMRCGIGRDGDPEQELIRFPKGDRITKAHVFLQLEFSTLGFIRHTEGTEFTLYTTPSKSFWVKGEVAKN